jgi:hypothetical protein
LSGARCAFAAGLLAFAGTGCAGLIGADFNDKQLCSGSCDLNATPTREPSVLASAQGTLSAIAADGEAVFWIDSSSSGAEGKLWYCSDPKCSAGPKVLASRQARPRGLALDAARVYWSIEAGALLACPRSGCAQAGPSTLYTGGGSIDALGSDGSFVYFSGTATEDDPSAGIWRVPVDGGSAPTQLATEQLNAMHLAVGGGHVVWATSGGGDGANSVLACPVDGCGDGPTLLASGQASVLGLATDGTSAYWTAHAEDARASGQIASCNLEGCGDSPRSVLISSTKPWGLAVDDGTLYFSDVYEETVRMCPLEDCANGGTALAAAGNADPIPPGLLSPVDLALGAHNVYWLSTGDDVIAQSTR